MLTENNGVSCSDNPAWAGLYTSVDYSLLYVQSHSAQLTKCPLLPPAVTAVGNLKSLARSVFWHISRAVLAEEGHVKLAICLSGVKSCCGSHAICFVCLDQL